MDKRVLVACLAICWAASDLSAQSRLDQFLATPAFGEAKKVWADKRDRSKFFQSAELERLLEEDICPTVFAVGNKVTVDQIGLRVSRSLYGNSEKYWQTLRDDLAREFGKATTGESLTKILLAHKANANKKYNTTLENVCCFFELKKHDSVVRSKAEVWLLIEVELLPAKYDIYANSLVRDRRLQHEPLVPLPVHPEVEETIFVLDKKEYSPLLANRPVVLSPTAMQLEAIPEDGLTPKERERTHRFVVNDFQELKEYQIEAISYTKDELSPDAPFEKLLQQLSARLPPGRVVTYEQLHRILGDFAEKQQKFFDEFTNDQVVIGFEIRPYQHGKHTYTRIVYNPLVR